MPRRAPLRAPPLPQADAYAHWPGGSRDAGDRRQPAGTLGRVGGHRDRADHRHRRRVALDVAGANSANGTQVQIYTCNGTAAQQWVVGADGTIRGLGKCLDVAAAGTANGDEGPDLRAATAPTLRAACPVRHRAGEHGIGQVPPSATGQSWPTGQALQIWTVPAATPTSSGCCRTRPPRSPTPACWSAAPSSTSSAARCRPAPAVEERVRPDDWPASTPRCPAPPKPRSIVECGSYSNPNNGCTDEREDAIAAYTDALAWYITAGRPVRAEVDPDHGRLVGHGHRTTPAATPRCRPAGPPRSGPGRRRSSSTRTRAGPMPTASPPCCATSTFRR